MSDKMLEIIWKLDIDKMNEHLPIEYRSLFDLLKETTPKIKTKGNKMHSFRKKELEMISKLLPKEKWKNVRLPIILLRRTDLAKGLFSVSGGILELFLVYRITGKTTMDLEIFMESENDPHIWKPEAFTAVQKVGSIFVIGYI